MRKPQASRFTKVQASCATAVRASRHVGLAGAALAEPGKDGIDGSLEALSAFVAELAGMSGQAGSPGAVPVLELMIDQIVTVSSVVGGVDAGLCISATMALATGAIAWPDARAAAQAGAAGFDYLWHAERGCPVLVRHVALDELPDEPAVMDAIADCAAIARAIASAA